MPNVVTATVKVIEDSQQPDGYRFETVDLPMGPGNVLYFRNCRQSDIFHVRYELDGFTGYEFLDPSNAADKPLWVTHGSGAACPTEATPKWGQFDAIRREDSGRTLIVENKNQSAVKFFYTLRIRNAAGDTIELDPGGENQNSGHPLTSYASRTAETLTVAGAAATVTYLVIARTDFISNPVSLGTALLFSLTIGFAVAALLSRFLRRD